MNVVGRTNKQLVHTDNQKGGNIHGTHLTNHGKNGKKVKKYNPNKSNHKHSNKGKKQNHNHSERNFDYNAEEFGFGE